MSIINIFLEGDQRFKLCLIIFYIYLIGNSNINYKNLRKMSIKVITEVQNMFKYFTTFTIFRRRQRTVIFFISN